MSEVAFARKSVELVKIRDLDKKSIGEGFSMLFTKISNLAGIKEPISQINKSDIGEMILMRFKGLSLEEIDYAFKLERYGVYDDKTQHFQLFDADYVSTILNKYRDWLQKTRFNNNIPITAKKLEEKKFTEEEKKTILEQGVQRMYEEYKESKTIPIAVSYLYDYLFKKGIIKPTDQYRAKIKELALKNLKPKQNNVIRALDVLKGKSMRKPTKIQIENECKRLALIDHFKELLKKEKASKKK
ncbi:hypothetical protein [Tenacibaculum maritimum]|uniref:hypothetical protein n=1 Tax=Tenacibaculum sp. C7A-26P2 TaxID=3447504 RepID=UPI00230719C3|nr:hypothetical protein [Tenacibaculum maritimum]MDB0613815.1 hypothetical protein [Tenacibaculum maritimum]